VDSGWGVWIGSWGKSNSLLSFTCVSEEGARGRNRSCRKEARVCGRIGCCAVSAPAVTYRNNLELSRLTAACLAAAPQDRPHHEPRRPWDGSGQSLRILWLLRISLPASFLSNPTTILLSKPLNSPAGPGRVARHVRESGHGMLHCFALNLYLVPRSKYFPPSIFRWQTITRVLAWRCAARVYHSASDWHTRDDCGGACTL
jgi:hypothetical protein